MYGAFLSFVFWCIAVCKFSTHPTICVKELENAHDDDDDTSVDNASF
jgi:hypothetical protein